MKNIKVSDETYMRLSLVKRGHSFNQYLDIMLNYFEATKIDPKICQESPAVEYLKEVDRLIKIVRAAEKKQIAKLDEVFSRVDFLSSLFREVEEKQKERISLEELEENGITHEELEYLTEKAKQNIDEEQRQDDFANAVYYVNAIHKNLIRIKSKSFKTSGSNSIYTKDANDVETLIKMFYNVDQHLKGFDNKYVLDSLRNAALTKYNIEIATKDQGYFLLALDEYISGIEHYAKDMNIQIE